MNMKEIVYREARLDEYQKIGKVLAGAFMDYPFMTLIKDDLKKLGITREKIERDAAKFRAMFKVKVVGDER